MRKFWNGGKHQSSPRTWGAPRIRTCPHQSIIASTHGITTGPVVLHGLLCLSLNSLPILAHCVLGTRLVFQPLCWLEQLEKHLTTRQIWWGAIGPDVICVCSSVVTYSYLGQYNLNTWIQFACLSCRSGSFVQSLGNLVFDEKPGRGDFWGDFSSSCWFWYASRCTQQWSLIDFSVAADKSMLHISHHLSSGLVEPIHHSQLLHVLTYGPAPLLSLCPFQHSQRKWW